MRDCYYTNESFAELTRDGIVYHIAHVTEGEAGYRKSHTNADLGILRSIAQARNKAYGLSERDVNAIVASSMAVSR